MTKTYHSIDELPRSARIYLYGAGLGGQSIYRAIKEARGDITVLGFIDDGKSGSFEGAGIFGFDDIKDSLSGDELIIISTVYYSKIAAKLDRHSITNYACAGSSLTVTFASGTELSEEEVDGYYSMVNREIDSFFKELGIYSIVSSEIVKVVESFNIGWDISELISQVDIKGIFEKYIGDSIKHLAVYPCAIYVENAYSSIVSGFENVSFYDDFKAGETIHDSVVRDSEEMKKSSGEIDAYFITTRVAELKDHFLKTAVPAEKAIWINDIVMEIMKEAKYLPKNDEVGSIIHKINKADNPLIFIGGKFYNNYTPTVQALEESGYDIFIISRVPEVSHTYPNPSYHLLPFENKYLLNINDMLDLCGKLEKGTVFIHSEGFLNPQFEGFKTLASNVYPAILMRKIKIKKIFFLYDLIKPFYKNFEYEEDFMKVYEAMLKSADGIILNSNTKESEDFLKYSLDVDLPKMSYYRYNFPAQEKSEKLKDGFHVAMVGGFLDDVGDEMRTMSKYVREILAQKIHVHYYAGTFGAKEFKNSLPAEDAEYFHQEKTIMDQHELIRSVSKYHAGWMVHNTQKISDMISKANCQLFKDLLYMFMVTTVPSAILLFGVSGLPMFINRSMTGILEEFPEDSLIPMELSEIRSLRKIVESYDFDDLSANAEKNAELYSTLSNNSRLIDFIKSV